MRSTLVALMVGVVACGGSDRFGIDSLESDVLLEGQPDAVVAIRGSRLSAQADVSVELSATGLDAYRDVLDIEPAFEVSSDGRRLAFVMPIPAMPELAAGDLAELEVFVTQEDKDGEIETESIVVSIEGLPELNIINATSPVDIATDDFAPLYSFVRVEGPLRFVGSKPAVLRATGEIATTTITVLDGTGGTAATGGPGLCAEIGYAASVGNGSAAGPGGCRGGGPQEQAECDGTGAASEAPASLLPLASFGGGGGAGGATGSGGTGGGGGGVIGLDAHLLRVPGSFLASVDGASGCPAAVGDDSGRAGAGGALWLRSRSDVLFGTNTGFSALGGFADRDTFEGPGAPGRYRLDLARLIGPDERARFFAADVGLGEHPLANAPAGPAAVAFAATFFQGPMIVGDNRVVTGEAPTIAVVGEPGYEFSLHVNDELRAAITGTGSDQAIELEPGINRVCVSMYEDSSLSDPAAADCRILVWLP